MSFVSKPFWQRPDVRQLRRDVPICATCGRMPHLKPINADVVINIAASQFGVTPEEMLSQLRRDQLVEARAFVVWVLRSLGKPVFYTQIGRELGGRDHCTVINLHLKAIWLRMTDLVFAARCASIMERFYATREHSNADR